MMNGKITRSLSGSTGRTSGILIASSFAVSFASVISFSEGGTKPEQVQWLFPLQFRAQGAERGGQKTTAPPRRGQVEAFCPLPSAPCPLISIGATLSQKHPRLRTAGRRRQTARRQRDRDRGGDP